jgi:hypothetical protein
MPAISMFMVSYLRTFLYSLIVSVIPAEGFQEMRVFPYAAK